MLSPRNMFLKVLKTLVAEKPGTGVMDVQDRSEAPGTEPPRLLQAAKNHPRARPQRPQTEVRITAGPVGLNNQPEIPTADLKDQDNRRQGQLHPGMVIETTATTRDLPITEETMGIATGIAGTTILARKGHKAKLRDKGHSNSSKGQNQLPCISKDRKRNLSNKPDP